MHVLLQDPWFCTIPEARRHALLEGSRTLNVEAGRRIYRIEDKPDGLYAMVAGEARLISYPSAGRLVVSLRLQPGNWFGELSVLDGGPRPHDAVAQTEARLLFVSMDRFEAAARKDPTLIRDLARLAGTHQRYAIRYAEQMTFQKVDVRLARQLLGALQAPTPRVAQDAWRSALHHPGRARHNGRRFATDCESQAEGIRGPGSGQDPIRQVFHSKSRSLGEKGVRAR